MIARRPGLPSVPTALRELDAQQSHFLAVLLELGGGPQHGPEAAIAAGYSDNYETAARHARILLKSPKILKALKDGVARRFDAAAAAAFNTTFEICTNPKAPAAARLSAAQEILNRSLGPVPSKSLSVTAKAGVEDLLELLDAREKAGDMQTVEGRATEVRGGEDD